MQKKPVMFTMNTTTVTSAREHAVKGSLIQMTSWVGRWEKHSENNSIFATWSGVKFVSSEYTKCESTRINFYVKVIAFISTSLNGHHCW